MNHLLREVVLEVENAAMPVILHRKLKVDLNTAFSKLAGHAKANSYVRRITTPLSQISPP
jgi:hypothetical protein